MKTLIFKISPFDDGEDVCWREVEITADKPLSKLAEGIVNAFGFDFDHAYGFYGDLGDDYSSSQVKYELFADMGDDMAPGGAVAFGVEKTKCGNVFAEVGQKMQFIFDYGDEWRFLIELVGFGEKVARRRYPRTINAKGEAPVQYPDWEEDEDGEGEATFGINPRTGEIIEFGKNPESVKNPKLTEILEDLAFCDRDLPVETLRYCLANREEIVPGFLDILNRHAAAMPLITREEDALFFIVHVLADLKETKAFQPLVRVLKRGSDDEQVNMFGEDRETLPQVLLSVYDGDQQVLYDFIEDTSLDEFLRNYAFDVWGYLAADGRIDREKAHRYLVDAFNALEPQTQNMIWGGWLMNASRLGFEDLTDKGVAIIQDGRMPYKFTTEAHFRADMAKDARAKNRVALFEETATRPFSNIVESLSEWASFKEEDMANSFWNQPDQPVANAFRDVGRNDPCPCGSGKKFKKCCLH